MQNIWNILLDYAFVLTKQVWAVLFVVAMGILGFLDRFKQSPIRLSKHRAAVLIVGCLIVAQFLVYADLRIRSDQLQRDLEDQTRLRKQYAAQLAAAQQEKLQISTQSHLPPPEIPTNDYDDPPRPHFAMPVATIAGDTVRFDFNLDLVISNTGNAAAEDILGILLLIPKNLSGTVQKTAISYGNELPPSSSFQTTMPLASTTPFEARYAVIALRCRFAGSRIHKQGFYYEWREGGTSKNGTKLVPIDVETKYMIEKQYRSELANFIPAAPVLGRR